MRRIAMLALVASTTAASAEGFRPDLTVETFRQAVSVTFEVALPGVPYRIEDGLCEADEDTEIINRCGLTIDGLPVEVRSDRPDGIVDAVDIYAYPDRARDIRTITEVSAVVARTLAPASPDRVADEVLSRANDAAISGRETGLTASNLEWRFARSESGSFFRSTFEAR